MAAEGRNGDSGGGGRREGVLLYYKYAPVLDTPALVRFFESSCLSLDLLGRVRIAPDGVFVTVGGTLSALEEHIATVKSNAFFEGIDFKLASCDGPADEKISRECGFTLLSVRAVEELVIFKPQLLLKSPNTSNSVKHLSPAEFHSVLQGSGNEPRKKLRILCLHGFRQNASGFKGRTASLAKKLKHISELVFVDAPHELPFIYHPRSNKQTCNSSDSSTKEASSSPQQPPPPCQDCKRKFAWLVSPIPICSESSDWKVADQPFDSLQYQQQTEGFQESYTFLKKVFSQMGPFDGILGFSQGAAMATLVCEQQWRAGSLPDFRFAILCSGFSLLSGERNHAPIKCPSLHIYGSSRGMDGQIACQASIELASKFDKESSVVIEHEMGHIIPTQAPYLDQMKAFLCRFFIV